MSTQLLQQAKDVVAGALKRGAQGVRASVYRRRSSSVEWRDGELDRLRESTSMGLSLTLYVDGRYSVNNSSDLRPAALERFLDETVAMTKLLARDEHRKLPDPERYKNRFAGDLRLVDRSGADGVTGDKRRRIAKALEEAARAAPGADKIISVTASCSDALSEQAMVASNGMQGSLHSTTFSLFVMTSVRDEGDRKPEGYAYATSRFGDRLPSVAELGAEATRRALEQRGAKPAKSGEYACVIENRVVGRTLNGLLDPLRGANIQQKRSFLADKIGAPIGSGTLTVIDHPHVVEGLGSRTFDPEGMSARQMPLFDKGVLQNYLLDTYYASKLGAEPTTGSTSNLVFDAGDRDLPALLKAMGKGILITGFAGGNSNVATGDFSVGIRGMWIDNGAPVRPLAEMNLAGNHLKAWKRLAEVGADVFTDSSIRSPSLRFDPLQFSGV